MCGPCRALFQTGKYPTETGCFRNNIMLPAGVKTLGQYIEEAFRSFILPRTMVPTASRIRTRKMMQYTLLKKILGLPLEISRARRKFVSVMLTGCFRNNIMLPAGVKTLGQYIEEAGYETAYIGKWHLASDGELEKPPAIDHPS